LVGQEMRKKILMGTNNQTFISSWNLSMKKPVSDSKTSSSRPNFFYQNAFPVVRRLLDERIQVGPGQELAGLV